MDKLEIVMKIIVRHQKETGAWPHAVEMANDTLSDIKMDKNIFDVIDMMPQSNFHSDHIRLSCGTILRRIKDYAGASPFKVVSNSNN